MQSIGTLPTPERASGVRPSGFLHPTLWLCGPDPDGRCQLSQSDSFRLGLTYGLRGQSVTLLAE